MARFSGASASMQLCEDCRQFGAPLGSECEGPIDLISGDPRRVDDVDWLIAGFPCQDVSQINNASTGH
eukprot:5861174-Pyramimonas_sp.AAC.1